MGVGVGVALRENYGEGQEPWEIHGLLIGASLKPSFCRWPYIALQLSERQSQAICGGRPATWSGVGIRSRLIEASGLSI